MSAEIKKVREETFFERQRRLKKRKQVYKETYKKGIFLENIYILEDWVKQKDVVVRVHNAGNLDDYTEFINITIEGIKMKNQ